MEEPHEHTVEMETHAAWLQVERPRIVRLCANLTGNSTVAEDLAQETLLHAWQVRHRVYDAAGYPQWLSAIARHVCQRWRRKQTHDNTHSVSPDSKQTPSREPEVDFDLELELERNELATLLDRALALLPPETRTALIATYIHDLPVAELAERLGMPPGNVSVKLHRGKLALRRILTTTMREDAAAYGLIDPAENEWQTTRIWCPDCGERRLVGRFGPDRHLQLDCLGCQGMPRVVQYRSWMLERIWDMTPADLFAGIKGFKPAVNRLLAHLDTCYPDGLAGCTARCPWCETWAPLRLSHDTHQGNRDVQIVCPNCAHVCGISTVTAFAARTPAARAFWKHHGRIRTLPVREVEAGGPAFVVRFESIAGRASLDVILAQPTLEVMQVHGDTPTLSQ